MTYKTIAIDCAPKAKKMAAAIEKTMNESTGRLGNGNVFRDELCKSDPCIPCAG